MVKALREEQDFQKAQQEARERRIERTILANIGDDDFTFQVLCERFSGSHPDAIRKILWSCDVVVSSDGSTLIWRSPTN